MIVVFIGPPFAGKDTQAKLLGKEKNLPVFSMGGLIRGAYERKDPRALIGFEQYSMKGLHLPTKLKFGWLKEKLDVNKDGFILDNFPANQDDLDVFLNYLKKNHLRIDHVFYLRINEEEMIKRLVQRGRGDDKLEIVIKRREIQDSDRGAVINYFKNQGLLREINGEGSVGQVQRQITEYLNE